MALNGQSGAILYLLCLHVYSLIFAGTIAGVVGILFNSDSSFVPMVYVASNCTVDKPILWNRSYHGNDRDATVSSPPQKEMVLRSNTHTYHFLDKDSIFSIDTAALHWHYHILCSVNVSPSNHGVVSCRIQRANIQSNRSKICHSQICHYRSTTFCQDDF